jgi:hypothetical protein
MIVIKNSLVNFWKSFFDKMKLSKKSIFAFLCTQKIHHCAHKNYAWNHSILNLWNPVLPTPGSPKWSPFFLRISDQNTALYSYTGVSSSCTYNQFMSSNIDEIQLSGCSSKQTFFRKYDCSWFIQLRSTLVLEACGSVVVKALCYKPEGRGFDSQWGEFFKFT